MNLNCHCFARLFALWLLLSGATALAGVRYTVTEIGSYVQPGQQIIPYSINNAGDVAGCNWFQYPPERQYAFRWCNGVMTDAGLGTSSEARGINGSGVVVGRTAVVNNRIHAFRSEDATLTDLGTLAGPDYDSYAYAVNNSGQIVGESMGTVTSGPCRAFLWENGAMHDLGVLPGVTGGESAASAINDSGVVVGSSSSTDSRMHAFRWAEGTMTDLGVLPG